MHKSLNTHQLSLYNTAHIYSSVNHIWVRVHVLLQTEQRSFRRNGSHFELHPICKKRRKRRGAWWDNERSSRSWDGRAENEWGNNWQLELFALLHLMHRVKKGPGRDGSRSQTRIPALIAAAHVFKVNARGSLRSCAAFKVSIKKSSPCLFLICDTK